MSHMIRIVCLCSLLFAASAAADVDRVVLESRILGEERPLNIVLPADYSPDGEYPVVYALDGESDYLPVVAGRMQSARPELIVVGIENVDRARDMFPDRVPARRNRGGGGAQFLEFIAAELIPYVEAEYATSEFRVLSGQSNSAFFVLYAMMTAPELFDGWLAASPMIGWDWELMRNGGVELLAERESFPKALFLNRGGEDLSRCIEYLPRYVDLLGEIAPTDFRWHHEVDEEADHVPASSYANGIAFIFGAAVPEAE